MDYIPTPEERIKIYDKASHAPANDENNPSQANIPHSSPHPTLKLSQHRLNNLIQRLAKDTKKDFQLKAEVEKIRAVNIEKKRLRQQGQKVQERLLRAGEKMKTNRQKLKVEEERKIKQEMKGVPEISTYAKKIMTKPLSERIDCIEDDKQRLMDKLNQKYNPKFKPQVDPYSLFIAEIQNPKPFLERVLEDQQNRKEDIEKQSRLRQNEEMEGATFAPAINSNSRVMADRPKKHSHPRESGSEAKANFQPEINKKSAQLAAKRNQDNEESHVRLYNEMKRRSAKNLDKRRAEEKRYLHQPQINRKSLQILRQRLKEPSESDGSSMEEYAEIKYQKWSQSLMMQNSEQGRLFGRKGDRDSPVSSQYLMDE